MPVQNLGDWLDEHAEQADFWWVKRLSANDTQATGGHQAGLLVPKPIIFEFLPKLENPITLNPRIGFDVAIDSHLDFRSVTAIWYNNRVVPGQTGTRNEARITNWGGASSPLLDTEATGALVVFAFHNAQGTSTPRCHVWVCDDAVAEDRVTDRIGPVEPGYARRWPSGDDERLGQGTCFLHASDLPEDWFQKYPSGRELLERALELRPGQFDSVDQRLVRRRDCEYELYRSIEEAVELPRARTGYDSMADFLKHAQSVLQRRRSRSGNSLELNVRQILIEEQFREGVDFDYKPESEPNHEPDFLFPSAEAYRDPSFPQERLRMLGVKNTLRDRWRQVLQEAGRIPHKHVLTLQQGLSQNQFKEIQDSAVQLVVPTSLQDKYPLSIRPHLQTLESFLGDLRLLH